MLYAFLGAAVVLVGLIVFQLIRKKKEGGSNVPDINVTPDTSGRAPIKKALLVGINNYKPELNANLRGCVNDIENVRDILIRVYGFNPDNIRVLTDDRATKAAILERLTWLVDKLAMGDEIVFDYSGHGSQVRDREGDELNDQMDEILCPYDLNWDDPLTDDMLAKIFSVVPEGVYLTVIIDACHSGTITKELFGACDQKQYIKARFIMPPFDIRSRTLSRDKVFEKRSLKTVMKDAGQNHVLLAGCKDDQTSADAYIDGKYQGAMTWAFTSSVKENPKENWKNIYASLLAKMKGFTQIPQLSGDDDLVVRPLFGGV